MARFLAETEERRVASVGRAFTRPIPPPMHPDVEAMVAEIDRLAPFFDAAPRKGNEYKPTDVMKSAIFITMGQFRRKPQDACRAMLDRWLARARQRYKDGFYADPIREPVQRTVAL